MFANNILQCITTRNYWDVVNEYKPLMHTWYVGIIMQFYIIVPLLLFLVNKFIGKNKKEWTIGVLTAICAVSLLLYLISDNGASKFYLLPFRLYEMCIGAIIFFISEKFHPIRIPRYIDILFVLLYACVLVLVFANLNIIDRTTKLLLVVATTSILILIMPLLKISESALFSNKFLASIGCASYSIFIWHQVVYACTRYSFTSALTRIDIFLITTVLIIFLSFLSYRYIEKLPKTKYVWTIVIVLFMMTTGISLIVYVNAGVVRDVPELNISKGDVKRGIWAEYCDRGYNYDKEFSQSDKPKWFIIGNSYGRDFVNIITESDIKDSVEISYSDMLSYEKFQTRFHAADVVFLSTLGLNEATIENVKKYCAPNTRFIVVGEKNFGECNGQVYRHRNKSYYFDMTNKMMANFEAKNNILKAKYQDNFIDLISLVMQPNGEVRLFTDNNKFISQDCRHLTQDGAKYFAKLIHWDKYLVR